MNAIDKQELPPELRKCEYEPTTEGESEWAVEVPDDASVIVSIEVRTSNHQRVRWGGGNQSGRWELRRVDGEES